MTLSRQESYKTLGLEPGATDEDIKKAYRTLAKKCHPDLNKNDPRAEEQFKLVNEAHDVLTKPEQVGMNDLDFDGHDPFAEFVHAFHMGQMGGGFGATMAFGNTLQIQIPIRPKQFFAGDSFDYTYRRVLWGKQGLQQVPETVKVVFEKNTPIGAAIRFPQKGNQMRPNQTPGDLVIQLIAVSDGIFQVNGSQLLCVKRISVLDLCLGMEIELECPDGTSVKTNVRPGTQHGAIYRLNGKGLPLQGGKFGPLDVAIEAEVPKLDSHDEKILREAYRKMSIAP